MGNKQINATTVKLGIYEQSNDSQLIGMLGQVKELEDGRKFVLCKAGSSTLKAGVLVQSVANDDKDDALLVNTLVAAGGKEIEVTVTSTHGGHDKDALAEGFLVVSHGTDEIGTFYKIKANDAFVSGSTATIFLYDKLTVGLPASGDEVSVCKNIYKDVVIDANSAPLVGVPIIYVTGTYYFWALFEGYGPGTSTDAAITKGDYLAHTTGDVVTASANTEDCVGVAMNAVEGSDGDALIVKYAGLA